MLGENQIWSMAKLTNEVDLIKIVLLFEIKRNRRKW